MLLLFLSLESVIALKTLHVQFLRFAFPVFFCHGLFSPFFIFKRRLPSFLSILRLVFSSSAVLFPLVVLVVFAFSL